MVSGAEPSGCPSAPAAPAGSLPRFGQRGLIHHRLEELAQRRGGRGQRPERHVARLVGRHRTQGERVQHRLPGGDVLGLVAREEVLLQRLVLLLDAGLLRGGTQQPLLARDLVLDGDQTVEEGGLEAGRGKEAGDRDRGQFTPVDGLEHLVGIRARLVDQHPVEQSLLRRGVLLQAGIGELGERHAGEHPLGVGDQRRVGADEHGASRVELEHRVEVGPQRLAALGVEPPGVDVLLPVAHHPGGDDVLVRSVAGQHPVDLQRLVGRARIVEVRLQHLLDAKDQARAERALERAVVRLFRGGEDAAALAEAEGLADRRLSLSRRISHGERAQRPQQQGVRVGKVGAADLDLAEKIRGTDPVLFHRLVDVRDQCAVRREADAERGDREPDRERHDREPCRPHDPRPADRGPVGGDPPRLPEDHPDEEVVDEEAAPLPGHFRRRTAQDAGGRADELVERGAFLRAGGEVEPAQDRVGVVARRLEHARQEGDRRVAQRVELRREAEDQRAAGLVRLALQAVEQVFRQAQDEGIELGRDLGHGVLGAVLGLEGGAPDDLALLLAQVAEELGEPLDEVGLREHDVDAGRRPSAGRAVPRDGFAPRPHGRCARRRTGRRDRRSRSRRSRR